MSTIPAVAIRAGFSAAMSAMYRDEVWGQRHQTARFGKIEQRGVTPKARARALGLIRPDPGAQALTEFDHYAGIEAASLRACLAALV